MEQFLFLQQCYSDNSALIGN